MLHTPRVGTGCEAFPPVAPGDAFDRAARRPVCWIFRGGVPTRTPSRPPFRPSSSPEAAPKDATATGRSNTQRDGPARDARAAPFAAPSGQHEGDPVTVSRRRGVPPAVAVVVKPAFLRREQVV